MAANTDNGFNPSYLQTALQNARSGIKHSDEPLDAGCCLSGTATPRPKSSEKRPSGIGQHLDSDHHTPSHTPRALSTSNQHYLGSFRDANGDSTRGAEGLAATPGITETTSAQINQPGAASKGKLQVSICSARNLKPSSSPYAVCTYDWIETIAYEQKAGDGPESSDSLGANPSFLNNCHDATSKTMSVPLQRNLTGTASIPETRSSPATEVTDPHWGHTASFDVSGVESEVQISIYSGSQDSFLGDLKIVPEVFGTTNKASGWYSLQARAHGTDEVSGEIFLEFAFQRTTKRPYGPNDFQVLKLIGKGTFGQVYQVYQKDTLQVYAMKKLSKKVIVQKKEVAHTIGERNILVRTSSCDSPFIVGLKYSFQTPENLYLVTGFMSGGELFWHLQKEGRFSEARAKFYIAELILALEHLHKFEIVYRDLKPENILLDAVGHIALCDFGLSKANLEKDQTTNTFCGTTEYLAPEVLMEENGYGTMVDFWSLGVLVFEMCCGWSPFYDEDTQQMYKNIAFGKVRFPRDILSAEGRNFVKGLLNRNPRHRLGAQRDAEELKEHIFFQDINWEQVAKKQVDPPFKPKLKNILDVSNFDPEFTNTKADAEFWADSATSRGGASQIASTPLSPGMQANFQGFTFVDERTIEEHFQGSQLVSMTGSIEDNWEKGTEIRASDRMSGVIRTQHPDENIFNEAQFDI